MKSVRGLAVAATVLTVFTVGCSDDGMDPGFSSLPNTGNTDAPLTDGSSGSTTLPTTTMSSGDASAEGDSSSEPPASGSSSTSGSPTGPDSSSGGPTNEPDDTGSTGPVVGAVRQRDDRRNEQCDGANLNGFTCEALGNAGGTLQCDPVTCTFDTQLCEVAAGPPVDTGGTSRLTFAAAGALGCSRRRSICGPRRGGSSSRTTRSCCRRRRACGTTAT
jgi:hypothetical protein